MQVQVQVVESSSLNGVVSAPRRHREAPVGVLPGGGLVSLCDRRTAGGTAGARWEAS